MTRRGRAPRSTATVQKSSSRGARSFERTARASPVQPRKPSMMLIPRKTPIGLQVTGNGE